MPENFFAGRDDFAYENDTRRSRNDFIVLQANKTIGDPWIFTDIIGRRQESVLHTIYFF